MHIFKIFGVEIWLSNLRLGQLWIQIRTKRWHIDVGLLPTPEFEIARVLSPEEFTALRNAARELTPEEFAAFRRNLLKF